MEVTYKKIIDTKIGDRIVFLLVNYDYIDGNDYLAKLFQKEYGFAIGDKIDGIWYSLLRISLGSSVYELLWHEDTGNELYCVNQTEEEVKMLQQRLEKILGILNKA